MNRQNVTILGVDFLLLQIDTDKMLLQANALDESKNEVPLIGQTILNQKFSKLENIVASETEILIYCHLEHQEKLLKAIEKIEVVTKQNKQKPLKIDVCFELGLDWDRVSQHLNEDKESIINKLLGKTYPLINYGFQPGFMYLNALDKKLHVPRLEKPRLKVPAGSLAIGGKYLGIYGSASPGGWNIIGLTPHLLHDDIAIDRLPQIGQEIKLHRLTKNKYLHKHDK